MPNCLLCVNCVLTGQKLLSYFFIVEKFSARRRRHRNRPFNIASNRNCSPKTTVSTGKKYGFDVHRNTKAVQFEAKNDGWTETYDLKWQPTFNYLLNRAEDSSDAKQWILIPNHCHRNRLKSYLLAALHFAILLFWYLFLLLSAISMNKFIICSLLNAMGQSILASSIEYMLIVKYFKSHLKQNKK